MKRDHRLFLIAGVLVATALLVTASVFLEESRRQREEIPVEAEETIDPVELEVEGEAEQVEIELYYYAFSASSPNMGALVPRKKKIFHSDDPQVMARQIVVEVLKGPNPGVNVFSSKARLRQVYILSNGTAVVDLSQEARDLQGGVLGELHALRSISRSLVRRIEEIRRVKFLVDGRDTPTFAGHVSIQEPFM